MAHAKSKTLTPLLILRILEEYSDEKHPITREEIEHILDVEHGINMERKAFFRHIEHLQELEDVDLRRVTVKPKDPEKNACAGFYLADRQFTEMELRVIIDALSGSHYLSQWETENLVERISKLGNRYFQKKMSSYLFLGRGNKTDNEMLMLNLEIIDEAVAANKQIRFDHVFIGNDGKLEHSSGNKRVCTPLRYFVKEHVYRLMCLEYEDGKLRMGTYRLSNVENVEILDVPADDVRTIPEFKHGVDWPKLLREHPEVYYLDGKPELCTFLCCRWMIDEIKIHFGDELRIRQLSEEERKVIGEVNPAAKKNLLIEVSVITDPISARDFAWRNKNECWLVGPLNSRKQLLRLYRRKQETYGQLLDAYDAVRVKKNQ